MLCLRRGLVVSQQALLPTRSGKKGAKKASPKVAAPSRKTGAKGRGGAMSLPEEPTDSFYGGAEKANAWMNEVERLFVPRVRPKPALTPKLIEERVAMAKTWTRFANRYHNQMLGLLKKRITLREAALVELEKISLGLYNQALILDLTPYPLRPGPPTDTPPIADYKLNE
eukprot:Colp12_sorted_trinity150504_noHs@3097